MTLSWYRACFSPLGHRRSPVGRCVFAMGTQLTSDPNQTGTRASDGQHTKILIIALVQVETACVCVCVCVCFCLSVYCECVFACIHYICVCMLYNIIINNNNVYNVCVHVCVYIICVCVCGLCMCVCMCE